MLRVKGQGSEGGAKVTPPLTLSSEFSGLRQRVKSLVSVHKKMPMSFTSSTLVPPLPRSVPFPTIGDHLTTVTLQSESTC